MKEPYAVFSLASLRAFAVITVTLMLMTAVAPALNKAIEDGNWPPIPGVGGDGATGEWSSTPLPEGAPIVPGHEYDAAMAISRTMSTYILEGNRTTDVTVEAVEIEDEVDGIGDLEEAPEDLEEVSNIEAMSIAGLAEMDSSPASEWEEEN